MPQYHFNVYDGLPLRDHVGAELADLAAARTYAARYAGMMLRDEPDMLWSGDDWRMDVTNEAGLTLFSLLIFTNDAPALGEKVDAQPSTP